MEKRQDHHSQKLLFQSRSNCNYKVESICIFVSFKSLVIKRSYKWHLQRKFVLWNRLICTGWLRSWMSISVSKSQDNWLGIPLKLVNNQDYFLYRCPDLFKHWFCATTDQKTSKYWYLCKPHLVCMLLFHIIEHHSRKFYLHYQCTQCKTMWLIKPLQNSAC